VQQIESDSIRAGLLTPQQELSPQQVVSCDEVDAGCMGGNTETAYAYVSMAGGLENVETYPYTSYYDETGDCKVETSGFKIQLLDYYSVSTEDDMMNYVMASGPLSVCLAASTWSTYTSGIITNCDKNVDHCVQVVGLDTANEYWIVRNSWGTSWGNDGYIYLKSGRNTCYITYDPTFTTVTVSAANTQNTVASEEDEEDEDEDEEEEDEDEDEEKEDEDEDEEEEEEEDSNSSKKSSKKSSAKKSSSKKSSKRKD